MPMTLKGPAQPPARLRTTRNRVSLLTGSIIREGGCWPAAKGQTEMMNETFESTPFCGSAPAARCH
jgi:hypothetical protein